EFAAAVRCSGKGRRDFVFRRGGCAVRQAQRGEGQPRSVRKYRNQLSSAAYGGVQRAGDSGDESEGGARSGVHAAAAVRGEFPIPGREGAAADLAEVAAGGDAARRDRFRQIGAAERERWQYP